MEKFKYLGVTVKNTNNIREEIKRKINMGNSCSSLEKILSLRLLTNKLKVNTGRPTHKTVMLPAVLYSWCLTLRDKHRLRVFENKELSFLRLRETKLLENGES